MRKGPLLIDHRDYSKLFPVHLVMVYQKGGKFSEMVNEAADQYFDLEELCYDGVKDGAISFVYPCDTGTIYLFLTDDFDAGTLAHECVHVVHAIANKIGSKLTDESEEFYAYLTEFFFKEVVDAAKTKFKLKIKL